MRRAVDRHDGLAQIGLAVLRRRAVRAAALRAPPDWPLADRHAREVLHLERVAHIAWEAPIQRVFLGSAFVIRVLDAFYFLGHFAVTAVFLVWLYRRSRPAFRRFRNAFSPRPRSRSSSSGGFRRRRLGWLASGLSIRCGGSRGSTSARPVRAASPTRLPRCHPFMRGGRSASASASSCTRATRSGRCRRRLPARRRGHDDRHRQPFPARRRGRDGRSRSRLFGHNSARDGLT